ncbi:MAG: diguanylate cyclase response regulator [Desulfobacterales bacterium]|nr:MAG: diguanylate cyclase response regulator [Desulfobacterales bacterium]
METHKSARVLVVDDDELVRKTLSILVSSLGYHCQVASNGLEAIEVLQSTRCDLVLTDIFMPHMDGIELLEYTIRFHPDTDVIVATGYGERASYAEVIKAGAIDFIKKPIDQAELEAKLARALRERKLIQKLEELSMCDGLTSLLNRRAFDLRFPQEVERAFRQNYPLFLALIDIDNFKKYNDTHGHDEGDKVLSVLSDIMREATRNNVDLCFRLGGDEFTVLLPQTTANQATEIVQRILLRFVERDFDGTTLSIGLVSCQRDHDTELEEDLTAMLKRADQAMYDAKSSGKNCVICRITG